MSELFYTFWDFLWNTDTLIQQGFNAALMTFFVFVCWAKCQNSLKNEKDGI